MKMKWKKIAVIAMVVATLGASISALAEEIESRKLAVIQVEGTNAHITRPNGGKYKAVKGMSLGQGNKVSTGDKTYVYIQADDDKTFKMDDNSIIAISKASAKTLSVELQDGELFFNVEKPLGADEELSFRAANTSMSIRGTSGILIYETMGMEFYLVEGKVVWTVGDEEIEVNAGEKVVLDRDWGGLTPAPGMPLIYTYNSKMPFSWTELNEDALIAVMEHRATIDLAAIGLDTPEEIAEAAAKVEEILEARMPVPEPVYEEERVYVEEEPEEDEPIIEDNSDLESIQASIAASIEASIEESIQASIAASIEASIEESIQASIAASIEASIEASIAASRAEEETTSGVYEG